MGGAAAGEVASSIATTTVVQCLRREWGNGRPADVESFAESLCSALLAANERVYQASQTADGARGMGTTSTLVGVFGSQLCTAQVGDSRAYLLRGGSLSQLTRDQTLVQRLVDAGELTEDEAEASEQKNVLLQALGPEATVQPDVAVHGIRPGDLVLVCSDGLAGPIGRARLPQLVRAERPLADVARDLINAANGAGGPDNITVVLARFS